MIETVRTIKEMIPESTPPGAKSREKRAWLPFLGSFAHTVAGVATDAQLKTVMDHVNALSGEMKLRDIAFNLTSHTMASVLSRTQSRLQNMVALINATHQKLLNVGKVMINETRWLKKLFAQLILLMGHELHNAAETRARAQILLLGVTRSMSGILSPELIPLPILRRTIRRIKEELRISYPQFQLVHDNLFAYYSTVKTHTSRKGNILFLSLLVPVSVRDIQLDLFQSSHFPLPLDLASDHTTIIRNIQPYIAVSSTSRRYLEFSRDEFELCGGGTTTHCDNLPAEISFDKPSCTLALLHNDMDQVHKLCDFHLLPNGTQSILYELKSGDILLSGITNLTYECNGRIKHSKGCQFCLAPLACGCTLQADNMFIPPRLTGCTPENETTSLTYTVNVGLLRHFFPKEEIMKQVPGLLSSQPINYKTAEFLLANHSYNEELKRDQELSVQLSHAVQRAKANQIIYTDPTDLWAHQQLDNEVAPLLSWTNPYSYVSYAVWICIIFLSVGMYLQYRRMGVLKMQLLLAHAGRANALTTTEWVWTPPTTKMVTSTVKPLQIGNALRTFYVSRS